MAAAAALEQLGAHAASAIQEMVKILWNTQDFKVFKRFLRSILRYFKVFKGLYVFFQSVF